jgi:RNA polymerase sigma factor (sigma-70 family)
MSDDDTRKVRDLLTPQRRDDLKYAYGRMLGYAKGVLKLEKSQAEEVVQAATLLAIQRIGKYEERPGVPFVSWLKKVLLNLVRDEHRRRQRAERLRDPAGNATTPAAATSPDVGIANAQAKQRRDQLLAALSRDASTVFAVWAEQNAGYIDRAEAAARLGLSMAGYEAAKKRVRREVDSAMERHGLSEEDLMSELPSTANVRLARGHGEEDGK